MSAPGLTAGTNQRLRLSCPTSQATHRAAGSRSARACTFGHSHPLRRKSLPSGSHRRMTELTVKALDAAMPFDYEHRARVQLDAESRLKIGIVGFGNFGQFLAKRMVMAGHQVTGWSRGDYSAEAQEVGARYFRDLDDFCEDHPDVVILSTSILSLEAVMKALPVQRLRRSTLFVDVLSVKEFPKRLLLSQLPPEVDILCTHPMFGPDSGKGAWTGLNFMYEKVRVGGSKAQQRRINSFIEFFDREGCKMVEMTCEEHDRIAASTQFITHTVGRMLGAMNVAPTPIDTNGYKSLLNLVNNTANDSFELYYGLFMYNQNATEELDRLEHALDQVKKQLFDRLHNILRAQLFYDAPEDGRSHAPGANGNGNGKGNAGSGKANNGSAAKVPAKAKALAK